MAQVTSSEIAQSYSKSRKIEGHYQEGSIVRIKCEDFLTYDSVEVYPGPNLNLIIGPNGSGKSSIVCAICLGLAGKTNVIGRASQTSEYVKHGCSSAVVEIELFNSYGDNTVIHREIYKNNTSTWLINKRPSSLRTVEEVVKKLNIQVNNLCQFLPQDRVSDFCKMSSIELLENTEKAAGELELYEYHNKLKSLSVKLKESQLFFKNSKDHLEKEKEKNSRLQEDVDNYNEQMKIHEAIEVMKKKRPWLEYDETRMDYLRLKEKKEELLESLDERRKEFEPLENKIKQTKKNVDKISKEIQMQGNNIQVLGRKIRSKYKEIEDQDEKITEIHQELNAKKQDELQRQKRLKVVQQQHESLKCSLNELEQNEENLQSTIDTIVQKTQEITRSYTKTQYEKNNMFSDKTNIEREINVNDAALKQLQDIKILKMGVLRQYNKNAFLAAKWLESNRDRFKKTIHGPLMLTLNMNNIHQAKFVEKHIPSNDLTAFVCEDPGDMNDFLKAVRDEQNLKVNTVLMPAKPVSSFKPRYSIESYRKWGFHSYLKDLFTAPDAVMSYLCNQYRIHDILIGSQWTKDHIDIVLKDSGLNNFYTENHHYSVKQSRYGNRIKSTRSMEIGPPHLLTHSIDLERQKELLTKKKDLAASHVEKERNYQVLKEEELRYAAELEDLRRKKKDFLTKRDQKKSLVAKINQKEVTIKQIENEASNLELEEKKMKHKMENINSKRIKVLDDVKKVMDELIIASYVKLKKCLTHGIVLTSCFKLDNKLRDATTSLQGLENDCKEMVMKVRQKRDEAKSLLEVAKQATGTKNTEDLSDEYKKHFRDLPSTIAEIDSMIHDKQAQMDCLLKTDESVVRDFKRKEKEIKKLSKDVASKETDIQTMIEEIDELKGKWLNPLNELIEKINRSFSEFFSELGCAGEISLKYDDPEDYVKYGISIKVKYRDNEKLQELTPYQQSGGERSVATILYLLALQELALCPFRCVDEINQGMDSTNERKIFELVVRIACKQKFSQYFLLTPKLLPDLDYASNMKIVCIHSKSKKITHSNWSINKFIKRRKRIEV